MAKPGPRVERKRKPPQAKAPVRRPSELEQIEAEIASREAEVADLERKLAADWSDVETLAAHKNARDALQALLARWEDLFDKAQG